MLILIILTFGCVFFLGIGTVVASWAGVDISEKGLDIKSVITLIVGVAIIIFGYYCVIESGKYYNKKEFTTSVPAQIDTTVTIKNGVVDTLYTYHLTKEK